MYYTSLTHREATNQSMLTMDKMKTNVDFGVFKISEKGSNMGLKCEMLICRL